MPRRVSSAELGARVLDHGADLGGGEDTPKEGMVSNAPVRPFVTTAISSSILRSLSLPDPRVWRRDSSRTWPGRSVRPAARWRARSTSSSSTSSWYGVRRHGKRRPPSRPQRRVPPPLHSTATRASPLFGYTVPAALTPQFGATGQSRYGQRHTRSGSSSGSRHRPTCGPTAAIAATRRRRSVRFDSGALGLLSLWCGW